MVDGRAIGKRGGGVPWELVKIIVAVVVLLTMAVIILVLFVGGGGEILDVLKSVFRFGR